MNSEADNYSFKNYYTGFSNINACTVIKQIALNKYNNNKPTILFAKAGNGKSHLVECAITLSQQTNLYKEAYYFQSEDLISNPSQLFRIKNGLVIIQNCHVLKGNSYVQVHLKKFIEIFDYTKGNILITTDIEVMETFQFSFLYNELYIYKPCYTLKEKFIRKKVMPHFLKDLTEAEIYHICSIGFKNIRAFEYILILMHGNKLLYERTYLETLKKLATI